MISIRQAAVPLLTAGIVLSIGRPILAQERQGCFMVNPFSQFVDLTDICPTTVPVSLDEATSEPDLGTGDIQATLRWQSTDDLDLVVIDPSGNQVSFLNPSVPSGGQLDVDANANCEGLTQTPVENVFWLPGEAPQGDYRVVIGLFARCTPGTEPIPFDLTLLVQGVAEPLSGSVSGSSPAAEFAFSVP
ncbi:MAG: hypothetical protein ACFB5Z_05635 [Elainellaceae cyanobacterium]